MKTELLSCPFCGGPVELEEANSTRDSLYGERRWWGVVCRNTINLGGSCAIQQRPSASKEAAIERWNRRTQPAQVGQVLTDERLNEIFRESFKLIDSRMTPQQLQFARAIEQAVLAKRVPMTDEQADDILLACMPLTNPHRLIRAAEKFHGIVGEKGGA